MNGSDCLFCRIAQGELDTDLAAEGDEWIAFRDISPQAPTHVLVVPRRHVATVDELEEDPSLAGALLGAAARIAREEGLVEDGYRVVVNCGAGAGQSVFHVHLHLLGGRRFTWPPG